MGFKQIKFKVALSAALAAGAAMPGCFSNFEQSTSNLNRGPITDLSIGTGDFQIGSLVFDKLSPQTTLNVYGDADSTAIGTMCGFTSTPAAGERTPCTCVFNYALSGVAQQLESNTDYVETNLLKCRYDVIPAGALDIEVRILNVSNNQYSNGWSLNLSGSGTVGLVAADFTDPRTFSKVFRFQCRQNVYVPNLYRRYNFQRFGMDIQGSEQAVYDPFQSHDIRLSFPLNFYGRDPGETLLYLASATGRNPETLSSWECALNPRQSPSWLNWRIFSQNSDSTDGYEISSANPTDEKRRDTFFLSKVPGGVFSTPVNAIAGPSASLLTKYVAPATSTTGSAPQLPSSDVLKASPPPLGYAARPTSTGTGEERCPTAAESAIPTGYEWAKLWVFKASTPQRTYVAGSQKLADAGPVVCNPGTWMSGATSSLVFPDCMGNTDNNTPSRFDDQFFIPVPGQNQTQVPSGQPIAPLTGADNDDVVERSVDSLHDAANNVKVSRSALRIFMATDPIDGNYGACYYRTPRNSAGSGTSANDTSWPVLGTGDSNPPGTRTGPETLKFGSSLANLSYLRTGSDLYNARSDGGAANQRPLNLNRSSENNTSTPVDFNNSGSDVEIANLENVTFNGSAVNASEIQYEYLFVVSSTDVQSKDMTDTTSSVARRHTPLRFRNRVDCATADPNDASCGTVDSPNRFPPYRLWLGEILADTSAPSSQRPLYPLCVLRKQ